MRKYRINSWAGLLLLVAGSVFNSSCRENTLINSKLSPASDTASVETDTLSCITSTVDDQDIFTSLNISGVPIYQGVGAIEDSFFGTTVASTYFNVTTPFAGINLSDTTYHIDSVYLNLPYSGFTFGDTSDQNLTQTYQVFYLKDSLGYSTVYYPNITKTVDLANPLSVPTTVNLYRLKDSANYSGANHTPALRIKLDKTKTMAQLNRAMALSVDSSDQTTAFMNLFNGICVRVANTTKYTKAMPYFSLNGSDDYSTACIMVYYHVYGADTSTMLPFSFNQSNCSHYNAITRNYSRYPVNRLINSGKANNEIVAVTNQPGTSIDIKIGGIQKLRKDIIINKADLFLSVIPSLESKTFYLPPQIYPEGIGNGTYPSNIDAGAIYPLEDRKPYTSTSPYYIMDGTPHTLKYSDTSVVSFKLGFPRELRSCMESGSDTLHLKVRGTQLFYGAYRLLAAGGNYPDNRYKAKLIVVHSSLKK